MSFCSCTKQVPWKSRTASDGLVLILRQSLLGTKTPHNNTYYTLILSLPPGARARPAIAQGPAQQFVIGCMIWTPSSASLLQAFNIQAAAAGDLSRHAQSAPLCWTGSGLMHTRICEVAVVPTVSAGNQDPRKAMSRFLVCSARSGHSPSPLTADGGCWALGLMMLGHLC